MFFGCAFLAKLSKKGNFGHPPKKKPITEKLFFGIFVFFVVFLFFFCSFFCVSFWRVMCQVRWPEGPPHLALNPPYFFCFVIALFGGFKGQVRWPFGPKPSFFMSVFSCFVFCSFPFFTSIKKLFSP